MAIAVALCALVNGAALAQEPDESRLQKVRLAGPLTQPMRLAVAPDGRVVYIERPGAVRVWDPGTRRTQLAGRIKTALVGESGLIGLALAPDFAATGHLYLNYARRDYKKSFIARVSRFTLTAASKLDLASETPIINVQHPVGYDSGHDAGDLLMTPAGDLFIATGDNTLCCRSRGYPGLDERRGHAFGDAQRTSANTNSPIGKILRITPKPDAAGRPGIGRTYEIPDGNLFPEADDAGRDKTLPEIYAMGFRNPFQMGDYDPAAGTLWMADYGPDAVVPDPDRGPAGHVELMLLDRPGFHGWPYCTMNNVAYNHWNYGKRRPGRFFDCENPRNTSPNNTGLVKLPPAQPAQIYYTYTPSKYFPQLYGGGAHAGPMYRYDPANPSITKFPQWFDGRRFFYDWTQSWVQTTRFDGAGRPADMQRFFRGGDFRQPMDMQFGPDGSLYVLEYGSGWGESNDDSGLYRIDYVAGNRTPQVRAGASVDSGRVPLQVQFDASGSTDPDGQALTYSWDFDGDGTTDGQGAQVSHSYESPGSFTARVTVSDGVGAQAVADVPIVAGNTRPVVRFRSPVDGRFTERGARIPFKVKVTDPDERSIDCRKVRVTYSLGHNEHAHPQGDVPVRRDCTGVYKPKPEAGHDPTGAYVYHVLQASFEDTGGAPGTPELTGEADAILHGRRYHARTYRKGKGVGLYYGELFVPGSGDWFSFPHINLKGIRRVRMQIWQNGRGARLTVRSGSPKGPVVARFRRLADSGPRKDENGRPDRYETYQARVAAPRGVHDLYFVIEWPTRREPEVFVGSFTFLRR